MAQSDQFGTALMATRYAHTLLFECPECNLPIPVSRIRGEKNLETIESESFQLKCHYCDASSTLPAAVAKAHWVSAWGGPI
jgi:primosomal protein N'